jgi:hypothetical protein
MGRGAACTEILAESSRAKEESVAGWSGPMRCASLSLPFVLHCPPFTADDFPFADLACPLIEQIGCKPSHQ